MGDVRRRLVVLLFLIGCACACGLFPRDDKGASIAQARQLRFDAGDELDKHDWKGALDLLDRAKAMDPDGDDAAWIQNGRGLAAKGLSAGDSASPSR